MEEKKTTLLYRLIRGTVKLCYPRMEVVGAQRLSDGPVLIVGNHTQMNGPIACELYMPGPCRTWCAGQMMHLKEVPEYAYQDFWSQKPRCVRWFFRLMSYAIAPLSVCVFNNANTIPVYHDARLLTTFRETVKCLEQGASVVIFPEHDAPYNHILSEFQDKFVDIAKIYYKRTGEALSFVPLYIAPALKQMHLGQPIRFDPTAPIREERERICACLMEEITRMACALPEHRVVPYRNIPKKYYPSNIPPREVP